MAQHRAQCFPPRLGQGAGMQVASTAAWGTTCCARSARPAGAERFPLGQRGTEAATAAAAAAPPGAGCGRDSQGGRQRAALPTLPF